MARSAQRNRSAEILTISVLLALFLLAGLGGILWAANSGAFAGPTPTATATPMAPHTPTPDFRATRSVEDMLTQVAYSVQLATIAARSLDGAAPDATLPVAITLFPDVPDAVTPDPTELSVLLPVVAQDDPARATLNAVETLEAETVLFPPEPDTEQPTPTPNTVNLPVVGVGVVLTPTMTPIPDPPTETPTETPEPPTPTPSWTPTLAPPTPTATLPPPTPTTSFVVNSLRAVIERQNAVVRLGPSTLYTQTGTINVGTQVSLLARDATGDWLYACCLANNTPGWLRGANARPTENPTLPAPLNSSDGNDVRWLAVRGPDAALPALPVATPAPPTDWPMARRERGNGARVAQLPRLPLQSGWPAGGAVGLAGQSFTSGAIVVGGAVYAASADGHLYSFDHDTGSQRWRYNLGELVRATPLADGGLLYVVTESGRLVALEDQGAGALLRWEQAYSMQPHGGLLASAGRLVFTGRQADGERLFISDRSTGVPIRVVSVAAGALQMPAAGGQLVFLASDVLRAVDLFNSEVVWQTTDVLNYTTYPVYATPGVEALAELYVADATGRLTAFDANTGRQLWTTQLGGQASGLAVNAGSVYASGPGFVRAFARAVRSEGQLLWSAGLPGAPLGGPVVDDGRVFVATDNGAFQFLDATTGGLIVSNVQPPALGGAVAVSDSWIFAPAQNGVLYAAREQPMPQ